MKRRKFLKTAGAATAAAFAVPYILPSGRLFATTGSGMADHVVYVLFAGGVRQQEAGMQGYLWAQGLQNIQGNILYNLLDGTPPSTKIVYGTDVPGQPQGESPIPTILSPPFEHQGTHIKEVNFSKGGTGHIFGLNTIITGNYGFGQGLRQRAIYPTIFEYVRRHRGTPASKCWFIGNGIGNSTPLLNYSTHPNYGQMYGANFIAPGTTFSEDGEEHLADMKVYHPEEEIEPIYEMKHFLDNSFENIGGVVPGIQNTDEERIEIKQWVRDMFDAQAANQLSMPPVVDSGDLRNIGWTAEILKRFKPTLTVINMNSIDSCHSSFTDYLRAMHRCDHGVGWLWNYIQNNIPEMAGNTALLLQPEHGRNLELNPILDQNDWYAIDHDSDDNSRRMFSMMAGPGIDAGLALGNFGDPAVSDATDMVPTIAEILGIKQQVQGAGLLDVDAMSIFDRI